MVQDSSDTLEVFQAESDSWPPGHGDGQNLVCAISPLFLLWIHGYRFDVPTTYEPPWVASLSVKLVNAFSCKGLQTAL